VKRGARAVDATGWGIPAVLATAAYVIHNMDEVAGLPGWLPGFPVALDIPVAVPPYAVTFLTVIVALVLLGTRARPEAKLLRLLAGGAVGVLLADVALHLALSALARDLMPGTLTGLAIVLPAALWLARSLPRPRIVPATLGVLAYLPLLWVGLLIGVWQTA
jgi:hypothetical protein